MREAVENEASLKGKLVELIKKELHGSVVFRHEDRFTAGVPDISITWENYTTWLEVKHMKPKFKSRGIQSVTTLQLALTSHKCWYLLYIEDKGNKRTMIVHPRVLIKDAYNIIGEMAEGFNHKFVVDFVRHTHRRKDENVNM